METNMTNVNNATNPQMPLSLLMAKTKKELINTINSSGLPPCILETIIKDIHIEVQNLAVQQLQEEQKQYELSLQKEQLNNTTQESSEN